MKSPNLDKYFDLRKQLLDLRKRSSPQVMTEYAEEDDVLDAMDNLWYKHLTDEERNYLNTTP